MMRFIPLFFLYFLLNACVSQSYDVQSVCEVTDVYNYVVKWEVSPRLDGNVEIFSSSDPEKFDMRKPIAVESISKGRAELVIKGTLNRCYFLLRFPDDIHTVVGVRSQKFETVQNFRDLGGYQNMERRTLKWGKLYRSGNFDAISPIEAKRIAKMKVKTFVDLRTVVKKEELSELTGIKNYHFFPVISGKADPLPLIYQQQFKRGDAVLFMQDVYCDMLFKSIPSLRSLFQELREEKNYVQASLASALVLSALDMPEQSIMDDYLLSNKFFNMRKVADSVMSLPLEAQDAITSMMVSDELYLNSALTFLKRR
ncbi:MAG: tyrosine-protein phosphatase, partial [Bacteroidales bacterium]